MQQNRTPPMTKITSRDKPICSLPRAGKWKSDIPAFVAERRSPGETLEDMALRLGISRIIEERMPFDGALYQLPYGERIIKLNSASPPTRKRFTLAHEIGHLLLGKPGLRSSCGRNLDLERKCDAIASELLMPTGEAVPYVSSLGDPSAEKLKLVAKKYAVSLQTAAIRLHWDFRLWKCCVGFWELSSEIKTVWFVGPRRWDRREPDAYSFDLALNSKSPVQSEEFWYRGQFRDPVRLNLLRVDEARVLGLVNFLN